MPGTLRTVLCALLLTALASSISAQFRLFGPRSPKPTPQPKMRSASSYISRQEPLKVNQSVLNRATPDNVHVRVSLPKQRAYLMVGEEIAADSPISSGRAGHGTPRGNFSVLEKIRTIVPASMATSSTARVELFAQASAPRSIPPQRNTLCRCIDEVVYAANRRRGRNARRDFARISRVPWLRSNVGGWSEVILRSCKNRHPGGRGRLVILPHSKNNGWGSRYPKI